MILPYPILTIPPDFTTVPVYGVTNMQDTLNLSAAPARVAFPQTQTDTTFAFSFTLVTYDEIDTLSEFFRSRCGRAHPFYLPSWRRDLPGAVGDAASHYLTVGFPNYGEENLTEPDTREDHYGRQIFVWKRGEPLWVDRVVASTDGDTTSVLEMERPMPFAVNAGTCIAGFVHLARFGEDDITWRHMAPDIASAALKFRGIRQHIDIAQTLPVVEIAQYAQRGFTSVIQEVTACAPSPRFATALGPVGVGIPQDAAFTQAWVTWEEQGDLRLQPGTSIVYPTDGFISPLTGGDVISGHYSLAFRNDATQLVAIEKPGVVELRADSGTVQWPGRTPIMINNRLIKPALSTSASDVVCYYLKGLESRVYFRFGTEAFTIERVAADLPFRPLALRRCSYSGGVFSLECLDAGYRRATLTTPVF